MKHRWLGRFVRVMSLFALLLTFAPPMAHAADFQVTSALDSGAGTLRDALARRGRAP